MWYRLLTIGFFAGILGCASDNAPPELTRKNPGNPAPPATQASPALTGVEAATAASHAYAEAVKRSLEKKDPSASGPARNPDQAIAQAPPSPSPAENQRESISKPTPEIDRALAKIDWLEGSSFDLRIGPKQADDGPIRREAPRDASAAQVPLPLNPAPHTDELAMNLERRARENPQDLPAAMEVQLLKYLQGSRVPDMAVISGLGADDREIITALMDALVNFRSSARESASRSLAEKARALVAMGDRLREQAELKIAAAMLCTRVDGFGKYEPIRGARFPAGREQAVILYCEVENFSSRLAERGDWRTDLTYEAVLYDEKGKKAWEDKRQPISDSAKNRRRDFFVSRMLRLPASLPPGAYSLKVTLADQQSKRGAQETVALVME